MPPSERPGTSTPAFGRPAAAVAARARRGHRGGDEAPPHMLGSMSLWDSVAGLQVKVDGYTLERRESSTPSGWTRVTTTVVARGRRRDRRGGGRHLRGRAARRRARAELMLAGTWSLEDFSHRLDEFEELAEGFRRWAFESAVLDLALRQNELGLGEALGRQERAGPLRRLDTRRSRALARGRARARVQARRREGLGSRLLRGLRELDRVRVVDLKAYYRGTSRRPRARSRALPRDRRRSCPTS